MNDEYTTQDLYEMGILTRSQKALHKLGLGYLISKDDKAAFSDNVARITYSLAVGIGLEVSAGRSPLEIALSRATATGVNASTGGIYSRWREGAYRLTGTKEESTVARKAFADWLSLVSFEPWVYATSNIVGSFFAGEPVNVEEVRQGMEYLIEISPIIGPTMGWTMDFFSRYVFRTETAAQRVSSQ